jgi:hypothetical protein
MPQDQGIQSDSTSPYSTPTTTTSSKTTQAVTLVICIQEVADSNLGRDTGNSD